MTAVDPEALGASLRRLKRRSGAAVLEQSLRQLVAACVDLFGYRGCGVMLADERGELHDAVAHDKSCSGKRRWPPARGRASTPSPGRR